MLAGNGADLFGLLLSNSGSLVDLLVNELLVGLVDERCEEEDGCADQGETPEWNDLDQVVGDERGKESLESLASENQEIISSNLQ